MGEVLTLLFAILSAGVSQSPPPLPELALGSFPPAAREAVSRAQRDAQAHPADDRAVGALGRILQAWEQWDAAHQTYTRAQTLAPKVFDWPYLDAVVLQRLARHEDTVGQLRQALAVRPDYLPARVKLAEALLESGDRTESARLFEALAREPVAEPAAEVGLGRIAAAAGRHDEAIKHFERAVTLFPELGAAYYGLARSYRVLGRTADADRALAQHARFGPRWPRVDDPVLAVVMALRDDARASLQRGVSLAAAGDVQGAIAAHEAALARDPSLAQVHANLVSLYGRIGNWAKAEEEYRTAIAKGFNNAEAHYDYAVVLGLQQKWDSAEEMYRKALSVNPLHVQAHNNLGQILERRRDVQGAAAEYRQAVEAQPTFRLARFNLGRMLLALAKPSEAITEFQAIQQPVDAETPRYVFALSTALVRAGRKEEGIKAGFAAERLASEYGQPELAAAIARELAKLQ
jgi:tetratricopeptide (TPR) repeat protein